MKTEEIDKHNERVLRDAGYVTKSIEGDQSSARDFDLADDRQPMGAESLRVGDARLLPNQSKFMPNMSKTFVTAGDSVVALDPFLHEQAVGDGAKAPLQGYVYMEPGDAVNERPDGLNFRESEESGIAEAGTFRPATPGLVGGREPSSYVVKAADTIKKGTFASVLSDPSNHSGYGEPR